MLVELLSQSNMESYNVKLANLIGLKSAIHLNLLIQLQEKAIRKHKDFDGFIEVDRDYVQMRTTLSSSEQEEIEKSLENTNLLIYNEENKKQIKVDLDNLVAISLNKDEKIEKEIKQVNKKPSKTEHMYNSVIKYIPSEYPDELRKAYTDWLAIMLRKFNFVSKQMLETAIEVVDSNANHNLDVALGILHLACSNGWKNMAYTVESYKSRQLAHNKERQVVNKNIEVSEDIVF